MDSGDASEVVSDLTNPEHRLPGEVDSERSPLLEDAEHWLQVYRELLAFKRTLLRTAEIHKARAPEEVVVEVAGDETMLQAELDRLEQRHDFWERRAQELQAHQQRSR